MSPLQAVQDLLDREVYGSVVTITDGPEVGGKAVIDSAGGVVAGSVPDQIAEDVVADALTLMEHEQHRTMQYGDHEVFVETLAPPQEMIIFGAVHVAQSLASFATQMGYRVTVADSRAMFATDERFPESRVLVGRPDEILDQLTLDRRTWVIVLSHEKRLEDPVIEAALKSPVRYIMSPTPSAGAGPADLGPAFDQQPIEVAAMADACLRAAAATGDGEWLRGITLAARWFAGDNDAGAAMSDPLTGGGFDGLHAHGANLNQGAESTLALIATRQHERALATTG